MACHILHFSKVYACAEPVGDHRLAHGLGVEPAAGEKVLVLFQ